MNCTIGAYWITDEALAISGLVLSLIVVAIYLRIYSKRRGPFMLSLTGLGILFTLQNIGLLFTYSYLSSRYGADVAVPLMIVNVLEVAGLVALARIAIT